MALRDPYLRKATVEDGGPDAHDGPELDTSGVAPDGARGVATGDIGCVDEGDWDTVRGHLFNKATHTTILCLLEVSSM